MPQEELFSNEDVKLIINQEINGEWSDPMSAEDFMVHVYKMVGVKHNG